MTIKPVIAPTQKRGNSADTEKKESLGQVVVEQKSHEAHGQSPCRDAYDELARSHRRSPHKNSRAKRRDHIDQHVSLQFKRDRSERDGLATNIPTPPGTPVNLPRCNSPHSGNLSPNAGPGSSSPAHGSSAMASLSSMPSNENLVDLSTLACQDSAPQDQASNNMLQTIEENYSGYNSGDEHLQPKENSTSAEEWQRRDEKFAKCMTEQGYVLRNVEEDGACLFRSISLQIYGDEEMHDVIRQHTMDYIYKNREYFSHFVTEDINSYIKRKRRKDSHGNHIEIQAMSEIYNRPVEVYCYKSTPINIFNSEQLKNGYAPLRLSYQRGSHYNAILDPYNATVGVGLGLAGYKPDMQTKEAVRLSEELEIEQTMFEDKLKSTDWEATNEAIEEQIARESYLQWCRDNLQRTRGVMKSTVTATITAPTATITSSSATITSSQIAKLQAESQTTASKFFTVWNINKNPSAHATATVTSPLATVVNSNASAMNTATKEVSSASAPLPSAASTSPASSGNVSGDKKSLKLAGLVSSNSLNSLIEPSKNEASKDLGGYASDDTDRSSVSSSGYSGGSSSSSPSASYSDSLKKRKKRSKKLKNLSTNENISCSNRKRRCDSNITSPVLNSDDLLNQTASSNNSNATTANNSPKKASSPRSRTPESEQQPCTSKQSYNKPMSRPLRVKSEEELNEEAASMFPSTSSTAPATAAGAVNKNEQPNQSSTFYQELLEASYGTDGFGQLSESEMLQRAIQMSTQDYIEDQKRRYLYGPHC